MTISICPHVMCDARGAAACVDVEARVEFSPSEGFDFDKMADLERSLRQLLNDRLNDAIRRKDG